MSCPIHPQWPNIREDCPFCERPENFISGGQFFEHTRAGMIPAGQTPSRAPDAWICRRVADFPRGIAPAGAAVGVCTECGASIAYNPGRVASVPLGTPQVCMQCASIKPLPIES